MTGHLVASCALLLALLQAPAVPPRGPLRLYAVGDINLGRRTARERLIEGSAFGRDIAEQPVIVRRGGWRVAFFAITRAWNPAPYTFYRHPGANYVAWGDTAWIFPAIRSLKESGRADLVVVSVHGGQE